MNVRRWLLGMITALALHGYAEPTARAQANEEEAKTTFQQGREALKAREFARALSLFTRSYMLQPRPSTLLNLATCEEELGLLATAWGHFREVAAATPPGDERNELAKGRAAALEPRLSWLKLDLAAGATVDARVTLDGAPMERSSIGVDIPVNPGIHVIEAIGPEGRRRSYQAKLAEGQRLNLRLDLDQEATPNALLTPKKEATKEPAPAQGSTINGPKKTAPPAPPPSEGERVTGYIFGALGVAGIGAGGVLGVIALMKGNDFDALCPSGFHCPPGALGVARSADAFSTASAVWLSLGLAWTGIGAGLILRNAPASKESSSALHQRRITMALKPGPNACSLGLDGTF